MRTRTFVIGLVVVLAIMIGGFVGLGALSHSRSRPEGVAENWLTDVGDTVRKGVEADATRRADKIGPLEFADQRLVAADTDGKAAFKDLEVGKAVRVNENSPDKVLVAFRVHARRGDEAPQVNGVITMSKTDGDWHVAGLRLVNDEFTKGEPAAEVLRGVPELPSDGGPPPSSAPVSLWIGALVGALIVGIITTALVKIAGRGQPVVAAAAV